MSKIVLMGLFFFPLLVSLLAVSDIFKNEKLSNQAKLLWIVISILIPLFGAIAYFFFGKSKTL
ncbi:PLDc N-terminal domain-containing protein [Pelobium sp.]|nr:PLDc N-terminal domain-containing protein [Pelobium sp.]MDA9555557.1 PLDc N-terminal domain-containing protein [Pelobium sp.]